MKNKPPYALTSVDNALLLLQMLRDQGGVRVSEAAEELGIARSTAHRLLAMLVYRDFAVQDDHRNYVPGPALSASQVVGRPVQQTRRTLHPHMEVLRERVQETVNLVVRIGTQVRFLATVESTQVLHVGDRQGTILPAHRASGGKALLAELAPDRLRALYRPESSATGSAASAESDDPPLPDGSWEGLLHELESIRGCGYSLNIDETEPGISAIGRAVHHSSGEALAALSIAMPSARLDKSRILPLTQELEFAVSAAEADLRTLPS